MLRPAVKYSCILAFRPASATPAMLTPTKNTITMSQSIRVMSGHGSAGRPWERPEPPDFEDPRKGVSIRAQHVDAHRLEGSRSKRSPVHALMVTPDVHQGKPRPFTAYPP